MAPLHVFTTQARYLLGPQAFPHHQSVSSLWNTKWKLPCKMGVYPFTDGKVEDFDPIFQELIRTSGDDSRVFQDPDAYAAPFIPVGKSLTAKAEEAERKGDREQARELYLRAGAVYRIARFPIPRTELTKQVWEWNKEVYSKGGEYLDPPSREIAIPFQSADVAAGDRDVPIQAYLRIPKGTPPQGGWPVLMFICGLDGYRTDHTPRTQVRVEQGIATLSFEIPGTGDCLAAPADPTSPDRLMTSILDWIVAHASEYGFNTQRILAHGVSTGGYYALRVAHTHADRLFAVVAQGGGSHHMFDREWIMKQDQMEYPFELAEALALKFGYDSVEEYASAGATGSPSKFSLLHDPDLLVKNGNAKMLIINGMEDSIFPIEDSILVAMTGHNKELICRADLRHMGNPGGEEIIRDWLDQVLQEKKHW